MKANDSKEKDFEQAALKLVYGIERDYKILSQLLLQNNDSYLKTALICMAAQEDEFSSIILDYLQSDDCTTDVVMAILSHIQHIIIASLNLEHPTQKHMKQLHDVVFVQGMIVYLCQNKIY